MCIRQVILGNWEHSAYLEVSKNAYICILAVPYTGILVALCIMNYAPLFILSIYMYVH